MICIKKYRIRDVYHIMGNSLYCPYTRWEVSSRHCHNEGNFSKVVCSQENHCCPDFSLASFARLVIALKCVLISPPGSVVLITSDPEKPVWTEDRPSGVVSFPIHVALLAKLNNTLIS